MGFVKVIKNKSYYRRYQVKYRRRRECKTDYKARIALVSQDKNKYQTPKYRFVVRFTNKDVVCQIFSSDVKHDICLASAYSHELKRFGITTGLTNYAAAYATGLLLARRIDAKYALGYKGVAVVDGKEFHVEADSGFGMAPFKALLDVGLARTTTGARVFGALKGAVDGGLDVPHTTRRFPGVSKEDNKNYEYDPKIHRKYIFGGHVADYMRQLSESDEEAYKRQFGGYLAQGITADKLEKVYTTAHANIRRQPNVPRGPTELGNTKVRAAVPKPAGTHKSANKGRLCASQRFDRIYQKLKKAGKEALPQVLH